MRLNDDGQTVILDVHGASVAEGLAVITKTLHLASKLGRSTVKVIHGTSTSMQTYRNATIKNALYDLIDEGGLDAYSTDEWYDDISCTFSLGLVIGANTKTRLQLSDVISA